MKKILFFLGTAVLGMLMTACGPDNPTTEETVEAKIKVSRMLFQRLGFFCQNSPMVMHGDGCKTWIIKKAEHRRIDAFELRC